MHPIVLKLLVVADDHAGKTVINTSSGTWKKNRDELPSWANESGDRMESVENIHSSRNGN